MSFFTDEEFDLDVYDDENILLDEDFLNQPIDAGLEIGPEGEVVQLEATFEQGLQKRIDIGELDPRNPRDKPLIEIGKEMDFLELARDYIQDFLLILRSKQDDELVILPFLNPRYVANAKVYLDSVKGKWKPESIRKYIMQKNKWYRTTREGQLDNFPYLNANDFFRYIKIDEKILN